MTLGDRWKDRSLVLSWGQWGGVYFYRGTTWRLCLGWVALSYLPLGIEELVRDVDATARANAVPPFGSQP